MHARARIFVLGNEDPAKMTHAEMALVQRGLGTKQAHTKSQSAVLAWQSMRLVLEGMSELRHKGSERQTYLSPPLRRRRRAPKLSPPSYLRTVAKLELVVVGQ